MAYPQKKVDEALALVDAGKSHSEVGRLMDIPQVTISAWVRNRRIDPPAETPTTELIPAPHVPQKLALASICTTAGTQMREESHDLITIADYAEAMSEGATFPPVTVFTDGTTYWLADGYQRLGAAQQVGYPEISAEIRPGTLRDAILYACGANSQHGLRRTNADKRKAVLTLLSDDEWARLPDRRIAQICGVTHPFVADMRKPVVQVVTVTTSNDSSTRPDVSERATGERTAKSADNGQQVTVENNGDDITVVEADPPSCELFPTTTPVTASWLPQLINEALAQLQHLGAAANLEGYSEYEDLQETLKALQEQIGQEVGADA